MAVAENGGEGGGRSLTGGLSLERELLLELDLRAVERMPRPQLVPATQTALARLAQAATVIEALRAQVMGLREALRLAHASAPPADLEAGRQRAMALARELRAAMELEQAPPGFAAGPPQP